MKSASKGLSLRSKLLFVLTAVPVLALGSYLAMATQLFERDKIAYVYDSSVSLSSAISTQFRIEIESLTEKIKFYVDNYDFKQSHFNDASKAGFNSQERIIAIVINPSKNLEGAKSASQFNGTNRLVNNIPLSSS